MFHVGLKMDYSGTLAVTSSSTSSVYNNSWSQEILTPLLCPTPQKQTAAITVYVLKSEVMTQSRLVMVRSSVFDFYFPVRRGPYCTVSLSCFHLAYWPTTRVSVPPLLIILQAAITVSEFITVYFFKARLPGTDSSLL